MDHVKTVQENSEIEITFKLSLMDDTIVEQTEENEVFKFTVGDGQFLNKLDELLIGLEIGTKGKFYLEPEQAFGARSAENFQTMNRTDFPAEMELQEGYVIGFDSPTGQEIPATIHELNEDSVVVDFNHPLAGEKLVFEAKIEAILD